MSGRDQWWAPISPDGMPDFQRMVALKKDVRLTKAETDAGWQLDLVELRRVSELKTDPAPADVIRQAKALLELDEAGALVPHGIGGLGRATIERLIACLETPSSEQVTRLGYYRVSHNGDGGTDLVACPSTYKGAMLVGKVNK